MAKKQKIFNLENGLAKVSRIHVLLALVFAVQIIAYDAGKLVTPDVVLKRWLITAAVITTAAIAWYIARSMSSPTAQHNALWLLILVDIVAVSFSIYMQRGMSSRAVLLYVIPILTSAILIRKSAVYLTAALSIIAYIITTVAYFVLNFNEGYKIELYGEVIFYSAALLIVAGLASTGFKSYKSS